MDPGETIDFKSGTLKIMTLRKDPMHRPKMKVIIINNGSTILKGCFLFLEIGFANSKQDVFISIS